MSTFLFILTRTFLGLFSCLVDGGNAKSNGTRTLRYQAGTFEFSFKCSAIREGFNTLWKVRVGAWVFLNELTYRWQNSFKVEPIQLFEWKMPRLAKLKNNQLATGL